MTVSVVHDFVSLLHNLLVNLGVLLHDLTHATEGSNDPSTVEDVQQIRDGICILGRVAVKGYCEGRAQFVGDLLSKNEVPRSVSCSNRIPGTKT